MKQKVRVRFAPSPTGYLHVGGARTALFNYLFARHHDGTFVLRIEDTDRNRYREDALTEIFQSLRWLGLEWDEGPETGGPSGPYFQSERLDVYQKYVDQLLAEDRAYRCFCTPERLDRVRQEQQKNKMSSGSGYDRHCRNLSDEDLKELMNRKTPHVIRIKLPLEGTVTFRDMIRGEIEYRNEVLDDLVLMKSDGYPTYHMANVVDDHLMKITHVMRGDEWIASTPRHIHIYDALGWSPPHFAHLPVILAEGGGKLSKRSGAASVMDYHTEGYLPETLINFLALLGWAPGDDREIMSKEDMIRLFSLEKVSPKSSVFDQKKLQWMNGQYLRERPSESIAPPVIQGWEEKNWISNYSQEDRPGLLRIIDLLKERAKKIPDIIENAGYFFQDPSEYEEKPARKHFKRGNLTVLGDLIQEIQSAEPFTHDQLEEIYRQYAEKHELSGGKVIHPTRLAISGVSFGPGLFELMEILGKDTVLRRMDTAIRWIQENAPQEE